MKTDTITFNVWENDADTSISLRDGESKEFNSGGATEEGYDHMHTTYTRRGEWIYRDWSRSARDCDGRLDQSGEDRCHASNLDAHEYEGMRYPTWETVGAVNQRDYAAEAMGY